MGSTTIDIDRALATDRKYYVCPECGFKQRSQAEKRIKCHRCDRSYKRRTAKVVEKSPDEEKGTGFFQYE
ncbi:MAG: hypothetical protein SV186_06015 [Candidatus Nanohaloarchaea archaeon]|nr:hypothetical protein [Candidatus Nanohaloarchaea archaeon]